MLASSTKMMPRSAVVKALVGAGEAGLGTHRPLPIDGLRVTVPSKASCQSAGPNGVTILDRQPQAHRCAAVPKCSLT